MKHKIKGEKLEEKPFGIKTSREKKELLRKEKAAHEEEVNTTPRLMRLL
jgi:hypothetical protein